MKNRTNIVAMILALAACQPLWAQQIKQTHSVSLGKITKNASSPSSRTTAVNNASPSRAQAMREAEPEQAGTEASLVKFSSTGSLAPTIMKETTNIPVLDAHGNQVATETRVGIGTGAGSPDAKLDVIGTIKATSVLTDTSNAMNGVEVWNSTSDGNGLQTFATGSGYAWGLFSATTGQNGTGAFGISFKSEQTSEDRSFGVQGINQNLLGTALLGWSSAKDDGSIDENYAFPAEAIAILGVSASSNSVTAMFDNQGANGIIISGRAMGTEVFAVRNNGDINSAGIIQAAGFQRPTGASCSAGSVVTGLDQSMNPLCSTIPTTSIDTSSFATRAYVDNSINTLANLPLNATPSPIAFAQTRIRGGDTLTGVGTFESNYVIPANTLKEGTVIEIWVAGVQSVLATGQFVYGTFSYGVKFGAIPVLAATPEHWQERNTSNFGWNLQLRIVCTSVSGAAATLEVQGVVHHRFDMSTVENATAITVDPTISQAVNIHQASDLSTGISSTMRQLIVKVY